MQRILLYLSNYSLSSIAVSSDLITYYFKSLFYYLILLLSIQQTIPFRSTDRLSGKRHLSGEKRRDQRSILL